MGAPPFAYALRARVRPRSGAVCGYALAGTMLRGSHALHLAGFQPRLEPLTGFDCFGVPQNLARRRVRCDRVAARQHLLGTEQTEPGLQLLKFVPPISQLSLRLLGESPLGLH